MALEYAEAGIPVFPCKDGSTARKDGKPDRGPITPNGFKDATTNPKRIKVWWRKGIDPELLDHRLGVLAGVAIGDLLGEVVSLAEDLAHGMDDLFGVVVILGEDQCLGKPIAGAVGEQFGEGPILVGLQDGPDLVGVQTERSSSLPVNSRSASSCS